MRVKDLIKKLQNLDQEAVVCLGEERYLQKETRIHYREYYKTKTELNFIHKNIFISDDKNLYINESLSRFGSKEDIRERLSCWQKDLKKKKEIYKQSKKTNYYDCYDIRKYYDEINSLKLQIAKAKKILKRKLVILY